MRSTPTLLALLPLLIATGCEGDLDESPTPAPDCRTAAPSVPPATDVVEVLILHDSTGAFGDLGVGYATMIANLAGHFREARTTVRPMLEYQRGDIDAHDVVFYIGTVYAEPLSGAFRDDFATMDDTTFVWVGGNFWQIAWAEGVDTAARFGLEYVETAGTTGEGPDTTFFQTVRYRGEELVKHGEWRPESGTYQADASVTRLNVTDPDRVEILADIVHSGTGEAIPYVVRSGDFFHVGDNPFSFPHPDDRYSAFTDLMHDFMGIDHAPAMTALFRLEDVHPFVNPAAIDSVRGVLAEAGRPWNMAMVPVFADPLGVYNPDAPQNEWHYDAGDDRAAPWRAAVQAAYDDGAEMVLHGYTHQLGLQANPVNGVTGTDFEFWDAVNDQPVAGDNWAWAEDRVLRADALMAEQGWTPWAFEVPHYSASLVDYFAITSVFPTVYHRAYYRDFQVELGGETYDMNDVLDGTTDALDLAAGRFRLRNDRRPQQAFPYPIERDIYGQRIIPETLGNVSPAELAGPGGASRTVTDILRSARLQRVNRCAHASLFYHPFIVERPDDVDAGGPDNLRRLVEGIEDLGYEFEQACALPPAVPLD